MRDGAHNLHIIRAIAPVSVADNTAQVGQIIDTKGFRSLTFAIAPGAIADADATFTVLVDHGDALIVNDRPSPFFKIRNDAARTMISIATRLGLSPADRSGLKLGGAKGSSKWAKLIA